MVLMVQGVLVYLVLQPQAVPPQELEERQKHFQHLVEEKQYHQYPIAKLDLILPL